MYIPPFLFPIICQQTFALFPHLAIVNSAAMKMGGLISLQDPDFNSLDIYGDVGLLNNKEVLFLTFFEQLSSCFLWRLYHFAFPLTVFRAPISTHPS